MDLVSVPATNHEWEIIMAVYQKSVKLFRKYNQLISVAKFKFPRYGTYLSGALH